jgi:anti-sigma B factor antagonist
MNMTVQMPVSSDSLEVVVTHADGRTVVALTGELDVTTAPKLSKEFDALARRGENEVDLDLSQLGFMDSSGLSVIVDAHKATQSGGGALTILSPNRRVIRLIQLGGLMSYLNVKPRMSV